MSAPARSAWRSLGLPALTTAVFLGVLLSLGIWQLERKVWKEGLIAAIDARAHQAPAAIMPETSWSSWSGADEEYRRVRVAGTFLHDGEVRVYGLAEERRGEPLQGFYVLTPLKLADGAIVFVNRGFVPTEIADPAKRPAGQVAGPVEVVGLVRAPVGKHLFVPDNEPAKDRWYTRDIPQMAAARGLTRVAPFYIDADASPNPGNWPRGGQTQLTVPNNHLGYAITWFSLAAALVAIFVAFSRERLRSPATRPAEPVDHAGEAKA
ncbi:MAG: SURF1 family protein [Methylobacteriaceae bacterium]|nr:SURF1 family protein [Methylobacteriaceae bacterium]